MEKMNSLKDFCDSDSFLAILYQNTALKNSGLGELWIELMPHDYKILNSSELPLSNSSVLIPLPCVFSGEDKEDVREYLFDLLLDYLDETIVQL